MKGSTYAILNGFQNNPAEFCGFCAFDVAFISVTKVFPSVIPFLKKNAGAVCLLNRSLRRAGEIQANADSNNPKIHKSVIERTVSFLVSTGLVFWG